MATYKQGESITEEFVIYTDQAHTQAWNAANVDFVDVFMIYGIDRQTKLKFSTEVKAGFLSAGLTSNTLTIEAPSAETLDLAPGTYYFETKITLTDGTVLYAEERPSAIIDKSYGS